jgi:hypothetical protein
MPFKRVLYLNIDDLKIDAFRFHLGANQLQQLHIFFQPISCSWTRLVWQGLSRG